MTTTFRAHGSELNKDFFERLMAMFREKDVEIIVREYDGETDYPEDNPAQAKYLQEALQRVENREGLIEVDPETLQPIKIA
jgi:hypothetical protein